MHNVFVPTLSKQPGSKVIEYYSHMEIKLDNNITLSSKKTKHALKTACFPCTAAVPLPVSPHGSNTLLIRKFAAVNRQWINRFTLKGN